MTKAMLRARTIITTILTWIVLLPGLVSAQGWEGLLSMANESEPSFQSRILQREILAASPLVAHAERYIVVHLAENRVFLFEGSRAIWSAPAGTGTGMKLDTLDHRW